MGGGSIVKNEQRLPSASVYIVLQKAARKGTGCGLVNENRGNEHITHAAVKRKHQPWVVLARPCSLQSETTELKGSQVIVPSVLLPYRVASRGGAVCSEGGAGRRPSGLSRECLPCQGLSPLGRSVIHVVITAVESGYISKTSSTNSAGRKISLHERVRLADTGSDHVLSAAWQFCTA